ncbi:MAG: glutamine-hydrolyzing carbamoyl-phosphate synthase small subunit [Pseudomonadota bacterium]
MLPLPTAALALDDGTVFYGDGFGATGQVQGEVCFTTAMTGYQESLSDLSYAEQIVTFASPHMGNVGVNLEDEEAPKPAVRGTIMRATCSAHSNWRASEDLDRWLKRHNIVAMSGADTRAVVIKIREEGARKGCLAFAPEGIRDADSLVDQARAWPGLLGRDLARAVGTAKTFTWQEASWDAARWHPPHRDPKIAPSDKPHVVALDFGIKRNLLRCLVDAQCQVTVVPPTTSAQDILAHQPDGIFLSNGPGDPAAVARYTTPVLQALMDRKLPVFGVCLGYQLLAQALGAKTRKMPFGHRGANHPVQRLDDKRVEITSQNHGFTIDTENLPKAFVATHQSLFDGTNEGFQHADAPVFAVQFHPEACPGPHDSRDLFRRFAAMMRA